MTLLGGRARFVLAAGTVALVGFAASTASAVAGANATCSGDFSNFPSSVGVLSGTYNGNVQINGACAVTAGPAVVNGNLTLQPGSTLVAAFKGGSLTVNGNLVVQNGATLIAGCNPISFTCVDDPNATTLIKIGGNLTANQPLGLVTHNMTVGGNETINGGGGGLDCDSTPGIFGLFQSPAYIDNEDSAVNGNLTITNVQTCWLGTLRVNVGGNLVDTNNTMADPDAGEVVSNTVNGNIVCLNNSPAVQFGDSGGVPNQVRGNATGQCGFNVLSPNPGNAPPLLQPISVKTG